MKESIKLLLKLFHRLVVQQHLQISCFSKHVVWEFQVHVSSIFYPCIIFSFALVTDYRIERFHLVFLFSSVISVSIFLIDGTEFYEIRKS